jgi:hypothetical protein
LFGFGTNGCIGTRLVRQIERDAVGHLARPAKHHALVLSPARQTEGGGEHLGSLRRREARAFFGGQPHAAFGASERRPASCVFACDREEVWQQRRIPRVTQGPAAALQMR